MASSKDWISAIVNEIEGNPGEPRPNGEFTPGYLRGVIEQHCPYKLDVAYTPVIRRTPPGHIRDWASRAAEYINSEYEINSRPRVERIAAIIATFAEPLLKILREARREHEEGIQLMGCGVLEKDMDKPCDCGADEWNARIDEALR